MDEFLEKLCNELNGRMCCECYCSGSTLIAPIQRGDWKHDHLYCKELVKEFAVRNNMIVVGEWEEVTESDGSDCYSSNHYFSFSKATL